MKLPKNQVTETSESDNIIIRNAKRPCPDLAIKSIKRDYEGLFNETYRVKVTIINQGGTLRRRRLRCGARRSLGESGP